MALSWALVEVPRYAFYLFKLLGDDASMPYVLKWLRYSLFIILYPTGISGEVLALWNSLDYVKTHRVWYVDMPNKHNLAINYYGILVFLLLVYIPGGPFMFNHMWQQRKKELGAPKAAKKD
jgi:very-long-chain (3R)-3-hydroxyacyl-CoA dehydratase